MSFGIKMTIEKQVAGLTDNINLAFDRAEKDIRENKWLAVLILVAFSVTAWAWDFGTAFLLASFLAYSAFGWKSQVVSILTSFSLSLMVIFMVADSQERAESLAILSFFLLLMNTALKAIEIGRIEDVSRIAGPYLNDIENILNFKESLDREKDSGGPFREQQLVSPEPYQFSTQEDSRKNIADNLIDDKIIIKEEADRRQAQRREALEIFLRHLLAAGAVVQSMDKRI